MKTENLWRTTINYRKSVLVQYVNADNLDMALEAAKRTFHSDLYGSGRKALGWSGQRACDKTIVHTPLRFGFSGGWTTIYPEANDTFFTMLQRAENKEFVGGKEITEVTKFIAN